ncbi:hypothetical protein TpMuguga_03g00104 [Theileria parva strain Muguga]|uniref:Uncharacterized protein n=1 Tax=Theileria parva TaxID=5875 RepID=Q4N0L7_THEPA|nr:uncharacterized protein TpMuguga_03g00104 [Theileria parva strain Muguga]EAN30839.1 hypothetical protein TpMuguga_03g00104 [Theileria parva strain Muguga]|eukprot:XP_763122.1 hypothetical protein [Theileria parva strain Muguga]
MYWPYQRLTDPSQSLDINLILLNMATEPQYKAELINGRPVLYQKTTPESAWDDITHTRHNVDNLEFYDLDIKLTKVSQCSTELSGLIFRIFLNFLCYHIKLGDKLLWSYCADPFQGLPIQILFNLKRNSMTLVFSGNRLKNLDMKGYDHTDWVKPGKPLTRFKTERVISHKGKLVQLFGEDEPLLQLVVDEEKFWEYKKGPLPISRIAQVPQCTVTLVFPINTQDSSGNNYQPLTFVATPTPIP